MKNSRPVAFAPPDPPIRLVAYQTEIPGNLGAMIRLAACFGAPIHIVEPCGFPFSVKSLRRSAMDYATRAEIARHDDWSAFQAVRRSAEAAPGRLLLLSTSGDASIWDFAYRPGDYLLLGRESSGVDSEVRADVDATLVIPIRAGERSLNVASAAAIALAHAATRAAASLSAAPK